MGVVGGVKAWPVGAGRYAGRGWGRCRRWGSGSQSGGCGRGLFFDESSLMRDSVSMSVVSDSAGEMSPPEVENPGAEVPGERRRVSMSRGWPEESVMVVSWVKDLMESRRAADWP